LGQKSIVVDDDGRLLIVVADVRPRPPMSADFFTHFPRFAAKWVSMPRSITQPLLNSAGGFRPGLAARLSLQLSPN
jgi:hypothetical protein